MSENSLISGRDLRTCWRDDLIVFLMHLINYTDPSSLICNGFEFSLKLLLTSSKYRLLYSVLVWGHVASTTAVLVDEVQ